MVLGVSNVIPGVSGGTMAVVFNVYDRIIALITPNVRKIAGEWRFWLPLALGMGAGILAASKVITALRESFPVPTAFFFIGLVLGSVPLIVRKIRASISGRTGGAGKRPAGFWAGLSVCFLAGLAAVLAMLFFGQDEGAKGAAKAAAAKAAAAGGIPEPMTAWRAAKLALCGAAAAAAMIIPGISGSFLLLALGMYGEILAAVSRLDVPTLIPFACGVAAGLAGGAALVRVLLRKAPAQAYAAILGLVAGSVALIFPGLASAPVMAASAASFAAGFAAAFLSSRGE